MRDWASSEGTRARGIALGQNLARHGHENFCVRCGKVRRFVEVDHIIPRRIAPELVFEPSNLQVLCRRHHREKTREDRALWGR
jgi:5-methylcytosine-specific restriction endonuclease McrA